MNKRGLIKEAAKKSNITQKITKEVL